MEPLTEEALAAIIARERPQGVLAGFGGQTGLNINTKGQWADNLSALVGRPCCVLVSSMATL
jgi:carbamoylphosphate synthase large subunit